MFVDQFSRGEAAYCSEPTDYYARGLACWTAEGDLIEAHKWFNLAAMMGNADGVIARAEAADQMSAREITEAQRRARAFRQGRR